MTTPRATLAALLILAIFAGVALGGTQTIRATVPPGEFRTTTTRASFGPKQTLAVEIRVNGRVVPFTGSGTRSVTAVTPSGVVVTITTPRTRGPAQVRMLNASTRKAWIVVRFGW